MLNLILLIIESLYHALNNVWALQVVLSVGLNPILKTESLLFLLMFFLHLAISCILELLKTPFWPLFCSHYICFLWGPSLPSMGRHLIFMLLTPKSTCPPGKKYRRDLGSLNMCLSNIKSCFSLNMLHLLEGKTGFIVFGSSGTPNCDVGDLNSCRKLAVKKYGCYFRFCTQV